MLKSDSALLLTCFAEAEVFSSPFTASLVRDVVNEDFLVELEKEADSLPFYDKNNDLYQFSQVSLMISLLLFNKVKCP